jgi:hypothetical protein
VGCSEEVLLTEDTTAGRADDGEDTFSTDDTISTEDLTVEFDEDNPHGVECSDTSFPHEGDPCSTADREARIACRQCSCTSWCCPQCVCQEDLHWSCHVVCRDFQLEGGETDCDYGTPPRCLLSCG